METDEKEKQGIYSCGNGCHNLNFCDTSWNHGSISKLNIRLQGAEGSNSIASALDKTKIEASSRLIGEMMLERREDGYYISYIIDRGKVNGQENIKWNEDEEKIAPSKTQYKL